MQLPIEVLPGGTLPTRAHPTDAGLDCYASQEIAVLPGLVAKVPLGIRLGPVGEEMADGDFRTQGRYEIILRGRSGLAAKGIWAHVGTIDASYRGELAVLMTVLPGYDPRVVLPGDRVAQLIVHHIWLPEPREVSSLAPTGRGMGGFGSTGR